MHAESFRGRVEKQMANFGDSYHVVGRKQHRCVWCYGPIPKGELHWRYKGIYDGDWQDWRMHDECWIDSERDSECGEFSPASGEVPQRIREWAATR